MRMENKTKLRIVAVCLALGTLCGSCAHSQTRSRSPTGGDAEAERAEESVPISGAARRAGVVLTKQDYKAKVLETARKILTGEVMPNTIPRGFPDPVERVKSLNKIMYTGVWLCWGRNRSETYGEYALGVLADAGEAGDADLVRPFSEGSNMVFKVKATAFFKQLNPSPFDVIGKLNLGEFDEENGAQTVFMLRNTSSVPQRISGIQRECECHEFVYADEEIAPNGFVRVLLKVRPFSCVGDVEHSAHIFTEGMYGVNSFRFSYRARPVISTALTVRFYDYVPFTFGLIRFPRPEVYTNAADVTGVFDGTKMSLTLMPRTSDVVILAPYVVPNANREVAELRITSKRSDNTAFELQARSTDDLHCRFFELRIPYLLAGNLHEKTMVFSDYYRSFRLRSAQGKFGDPPGRRTNEVEMEFVFFGDHRDAQNLFRRLEPEMAKADIHWNGSRFIRDTERDEMFGGMIASDLRDWDSHRTAFGLHKTELVNCIVSIRAHTEGSDEVDDRVIVLEGADAIVNWFYNTDQIRRLGDAK